MSKVVVIGELNVDVILNDLTKAPEIGKEVLANKLDITLGSSSAIFAHNLSVLGMEVGFVGKIGRDYYGEVVLDCLKAVGVDVSGVIRDSEVSTGATFVMNVGNDRSMVTYPGSMYSFSINDLNWDYISSARHMHVSSVFLQPLLKPHIVEIFRKGKELGLSTSLDVQWDPQEKWDLNLTELLKVVDVFLPNEIEVIKLSGCENLFEAIDQISNHANLLVVKLGERGSYTCNNDVLHFVPSYKSSNFHDAIGAGDSFNAGFIYKYLKGFNVRECQAYGNLIGAISTTAPGGIGAFSCRNSLLSLLNDNFECFENET